MSSAAPFQPPGQPQSKSAPTAQLSISQGTKVDDDVVQKPPPVERTKAWPNRPTAEPNKINSGSSQATMAFIGRVLAPDKYSSNESQPSALTIEEILPPLTSSNEVDIELYAILAIIIKDFVNVWYTKITPDHAFVDEIIQIFAHCSRALEQRLRQVDLTAVLLDEIPLLIQSHFEAYRIATAAVLATPYDITPRHIYHDLLPRPALSPLPIKDSSTIKQQEQNEAAYRQLLVQGALAVLLPTEDLQNDPLRILVGDILADLIIGQALAGKVCYGWFLHDAITKVTLALDNKVQPKASGSQLRDDAQNRLEKFGLLSPDSKFQHRHSPATVQSAAVGWFWRIMQYGYLVFLFLRYVLKECHLLRNHPKRQHRSRPITPSKLANHAVSTGPHAQSSTLVDLSPQPVLAFGTFGMISTLLKLADRMPWLASTMVFCQHVLLDGPGRVGNLNTLLDRFLHSAIEQYVLPPSLLPLMLRNLRTALFPNNSMGPPAPPPPSLEQRREIRREAADTLIAHIPHFVARHYYATYDSADMADSLEIDILQPLDDEYLNKHLVYGIIELLLIRLIPELAEKSVSELLAERGVTMEEESLTDNTNDGP